MDKFFILPTMATSFFTVHTNSKHRYELSVSTEVRIEINKMM